MARRRTGLACGLAHIFVPLIPVSQFFPLQNRMADRYLWLSVLSLSWLIALLMRKFERIGSIAGRFLLVLFGAGTVRRANLFSDSVSLFTDATNKTTQSTTAPYLLGISPDYAQLMKWCDKATRMSVHTNPAISEQVANAIGFGARGIGLCRTEHMSSKATALSHARNDHGQRRG